MLKHVNIHNIKKKKKNEKNKKKMKKHYLKCIKCLWFVTFQTKHEYFNFIKKKFLRLSILFKNDCTIIKFFCQLKKKFKKISLLKSPQAHKKAFSQYQHIQYYCIWTFFLLKKTKKFFNVLYSIPSSYSNKEILIEMQN